MIEKNTKRGGVAGVEAGNCMQVRVGSHYHSRDYKYVLRLSGEELAVVRKYRDELVACTAGFAEVFYNYLFDNPGIAEVLYAYEEQGGDVGQFARAELANLLASIAGDIGGQREDELLMAGRRYLQRNFRPVWLIGAYNLLIDYMHTMLSGMEMHPAVRDGDASGRPYCTGHAADAPVVTGNGYHAGRLLDAGARQ